MSKQQPTCPMCGGEVEQSRGFLYLQFDCESDKCRARTFIPLINISEDEALKRFTTRPESAHTMYKRLSRVYSTDFIGKLHKKICEINNFQYTGISSSMSAFHDKEEQEAILIMQQIEKELKDENS